MTRKWLIVAGITLFLIFAVIAVSCSKDKGVIDTTSPGVVNVLSVTTSPDTANILNDPVWDDAEEASIRIGEDAQHTNDLGLGIVKVKAVADTAYLYMRFFWKDSTKSQRPGYWTYLAKDTNTCKVWTQNADSNCHEDVTLLNPRWENEDVLAMLIDYGNNGTEKADCATTCHYGSGDTTGNGLYHYTRGGGNIDGWVWRAGRTNPLGLADDQFWGPRDRLTHDDGYTANTYVKNGVPDQDYETPAWMRFDSPSYKGDFLFTPDTVQLNQDLSVGWQPGDGIPGYSLNTLWNVGITSRYDVKAKAEYDDVLKRWTVVMWRRLTTPYLTEDVDFNDGRKDYQATLAVMDHAYERHSGSQPFMIKFQ